MNGTFADRVDAGRRLAGVLAGLRGENPIVLALLRGGVPVGYEVAQALGVPLDVFIVRKLGAPSQPELGLGAVTEGGTVFIDDRIRESIGVSREQVREIAAREMVEVARRIHRFRDGRPLPDLNGRTVVVVDDGIATGGTVRAVLRALRAQYSPRRIVLAIPVAPAETVEALRQEADAVACLEAPEMFWAIGDFYESFPQLSDEEVSEWLARARGTPGEHAVSIPCDGQQVHGTLGIPPGAVAVVLFAHGSGSSRFSPRNRFVASALRAAGLGTLLVDLLTEDEERVDAIDGRYRFDIALLTSRLVAVTDWLAAAPETRSLHIGYFGASTGAAAALAAAADRDEVVGAIVSRGGRADLAASALPRVRAPTLLIVGQRDVAVIELNREALELLPGEKRLEIVPGASHLFEEPGTLEEVARLAAGWFVRYLAPRWEELRP